MLTTIRSNLIARLRGFHQDEAGDTIQAVAVGAVGLGLAALIFKTMNAAITGGGGGGGSGSSGGGFSLSGLLSSVLGGLASGIGTAIVP
jgi:hypothetical protein